MTAARVRAFRAGLMAWFRAEGRDYPWRRTTDPYAIFVSEVMLQQTQIATVLNRGFYTRWLEKFPDVRTLATAPEDDILKAWEGLGYYRRARQLQRAAQHIVGHHGGVFPDTLEEIAALPGAGRYTAGAVYSFAWNRPAPVVDGNVARVLARVFAITDEIDRPAAQRRLWELAETLTDPRRPRIYNSAIMELGQRLCTKGAPHCRACPVRPFCESAGPRAASLPRRRPARATVFLTEHVIWCLRRGRLLLSKESGRRRTGLWRLPERAEMGDSPKPRSPLLRAVYSLTHHRITLCVHHDPAAQPQDGESWHSVRNLHRLAMPGPFRKVIDRLVAPASGR